MAPNITSSDTNFERDNAIVRNSEEPNKKSKYKPKLIWGMVIFMLYIHLTALYGLYLVFVSAKLLTTLFAISLHYFSALGLTLGAHRLWAHRSYKATWPLRLILMLLSTVAFQYSLINWVRDHRTHHKFTETDADPHNSKRGFFFSHVGWLLHEKHPEVKSKKDVVDMSDLYDDPILVFQKKHYVVLLLLCCFIIPTMVPVFFWSESWINSYAVATIFRYAITLNCSFAINSVAHRYGSKPYDKDIAPTQSLIISLFTVGEAWHNFHHTFPWDYTSSELRGLIYNQTQVYIDMLAKIGWAYDRKVASPELIKSVMKNKGDGTQAYTFQI